MFMAKMLSHCFPQNLQYDYSHSVERNNVLIEIVLWQSSQHHLLPFRMEIIVSYSWEKNNATNFLLPFNLYDELMCHKRITYILFILLWHVKRL